MAGIRMELFSQERHFRCRRIHYRKNRLFAFLPDKLTGKAGITRIMCDTLLNHAGWLSAYHFIDKQIHDSNLLFHLAC